MNNTVAISSVVHAIGGSFILVHGTTHTGFKFPFAKSEESKC